VPYHALAPRRQRDGPRDPEADRAVPDTRVVGLELELPGTSELIWASAEPRFHSVGSKTHFSGLHFVGMATKQRA
jgi:hypothetical protein